MKTCDFARKVVIRLRYFAKKTVFNPLQALQKALLKSLLAAFGKPLKAL